MNAFCKILQFNEIEKRSLENALGKDIIHKHLGIEVSLSESKELLADSVTSNMILLQMRKLKNEGSIHEALQVASFFEKVFSLAPNIRKANNSLYAKILNEEVRCLGYIEKSETLYLKIQKMTDTALQIGKELNDSDITSMAHMNIGGCLYVAQRVEESTNYLERTFDIVNNDTKVEYIRTLLINYALLRNISGYKETYKKADKILSEKDKYNQSHIGSIYEATCRSLALTGKFTEANKILNTINTSNLESFYQSEVLRGKMFVSYQEFVQKGKTDKDQATDIFRNSRQPKFDSFQRHRDQISKMYQKIYHG